MTGAEQAWNVLTRLGVDVVFGVPGGAILPLVDAMVAKKETLEFIVTRHESAAIHAADGYARVSGRPGVVLATSGPGGTNVITGLSTAMADSVPIVLVLGQVPTALIGTDAFQEADLFSMTMPVVKHSWRIRHPDEIGPVLAEAYETARVGRPGPVVVEFPKDTQLAELTGSPPTPEVTLPASFLRTPPLAWARARAYLARARRPVFYVGGGVNTSDTAGLVRQMAERYQAPVTTTLMGLGAFPASHPLSLGMLGMHGTWTANQAMQEADLILALGVRFDDRVTGRVDAFAPKARIIHVEIDPAEVNKIISADAVLRGDLRRILPKLDKMIPVRSHRAWLNLLAQWKREHPLRVPKSPPGTVSAPRALEILRNVIRPQDVVVTEVGQHQMWAALFIPRELPRTFVTSGGVGTMGHGFPAAMGAQVAKAGSRVFLIAGDGSFQMNLQELATLVQYRIPIRIIVLNNQGHGMVRQWQDLFHGHRRYGVKLLNPDFVKLAEAYGMRGFTVNSEAALEEALEVMTGVEGPVLLEVVVPEDEHVYPMVPAGRSLSEVIEGS